MEKSSLSENKRVLAIKELIKRENQKKIEYKKNCSKNPKKCKDCKDSEECKRFTQEKLAEMLEMEPQNLSRCLCSGKISEKMCRKIAKVFPEYRIEWLLGDDDFPTMLEKIENDEHFEDLFTDSMWGVLEKSLNKEGKSLKFVHKAGQHVDSRQRFLLENDCYYSVVDFQGKELKRLDPFEMLQIEEMIQEYADFIAGKYL